MNCSDYDAARLRDQFGRDERVSELGIEVTILEGKAFLSGKVLTEERRQAVGEVAREVLPHCTVVNEVTVTVLEEPNREDIR